MSKICCIYKNLNFFIIYNVNVAVFIIWHSICKYIVGTYFYSNFTTTYAFKKI